VQVIAPVLSGSIYRPAEPISRNAIEIWFNGNYNVIETTDIHTVGGISSPKNTVQGIGTLPITVPSSFVGMHYNRPLALGNQLPVLGDIIRIHDVGGVLPSLARGHWAGINPSNGVFDWTFLDQVIDKFYNLGCVLVYTLCVTPNWASARPSEAGAYGLGTAAEPSDMSYWQAFCFAVATRYIGKIKYYEVWNEPNIPNFFSGTVTQLSQMVRLANQTIKAIDPSALIICPPVTGLYTGGTGIAYFNALCAASDGGGGVAKDWFDVISCHLYGPTSLTMGSVALQMCTDFKAAVASQGLSGLEIWNTEAGLLSPDSKTLGPDRIRYLKRNMLIAAAMGFKKWFLYAYDHDTMGINDSQIVLDDFEAWVRFIEDKQITTLNNIYDNRTVGVIGGAQLELRY
jgi:hypothetical protein